MPAGLQVFNNGGVLQITESYKNYLFESKLTLTGVINLVFPRNGWFYQIVAPNDSMIAFRPSPGIDVGLYATTIGATTTTYEFVSPTTGPDNPVCSFYIFSVTKSPPSVKYGLEIYAANGTLAFSSNNQYMKPIFTWSGQDYQADVYANETPYGKLMYAGAGPNMAVTVAGPAGAYVMSAFSDGDGTTWWDEDISSCAYAFVNDSLYMQDVSAGGRSGQFQGTITQGGYYYSQYYGMMVDITGL